MTQDGESEGYTGADHVRALIHHGAPGIVDVVIANNAELPESTLLMLVSALAGKEHILAAYEEAVRERYRFFSFGDAMFIE